MTTMILGADGMLGHKMVQTLREFGPILGTVRRPAAAYQHIELLRRPDILHGVDALDPTSLLELVDKHRPAVVVNCIGIIKQRPDASDAIPSITINALLPHRLAALQSRHGGRVIHFSTDCVFDGTRGGYTEADPSDAVDLYGRTKYLGEVATPGALTLRTSIIGRELFTRRSLLEWFLARKGETIRGFTRAIYSGVTTNYLARVVARLIRDHPALSGLYQVASRPLSKYDLLVKLRRAYDLDVDITPADGVAIDRSFTGTKFTEATGIETPEWDVLVAALAADPTPYRQWQQQHPEPSAIGASRA